MCYPILRTVYHWFTDGHGAISRSGILVLVGLIVFVAIEKLFSVIEQFGERDLDEQAENNNTKGITDENKKRQVKNVQSILRAGYSHTFRFTDNRVLEPGVQHDRQLHPRPVVGGRVRGVHQARRVHHVRHTGARNTPRGRRLRHSPQVRLHAVERGRLSNTDGRRRLDRRHVRHRFQRRRQLDGYIILLRFINSTKSFVIAVQTEALDKTACLPDTRYEIFLLNYLGSMW